jgi:hypothetical protein
LDVQAQLGRQVDHIDQQQRREQHGKRRGVPQQQRQCDGQAERDIA